METFACAGVVAALAVGLVLLCTNHGVGLTAGSLRILSAAQSRAPFASPSPLTSAIDALLVTAKRDPAAAFRWPAAILLALTALMAAHAVYFTAPRRVWPGVLTAALVVTLQPVLHAFTLLRPEPLVTIGALACLALAADFARTRNALLLVGAVVGAFLAVVAFLPAAVVVPAAAVTVATGRRGRNAPPALGHAAFAVLYAATAPWFRQHNAPAAVPVLLFAPSMAAAAVFAGSLVARAVNKTVVVVLAAVAAASFAVSMPWIVGAQRNGHDFATVQFQHSEVMHAVHALRHTARDATLYSNLPEVLALYDHRGGDPLPSTPAERETFIHRFTTEPTFLVWFDNAPGNLADLNALVPLEQYREVPGGAIYRADAAVWQGGRRTPSYNPDTPAVAARRSAGNFPWWNAKHDGYVQRAAKGDVDLLFLGDSITDDYRKIPGAWDFFEQRYGPDRPANFGIDGDRTQHLLFRILNGECDHIAPKVAVILIGTNNTAEDSPEAIAKGIEACVKATRAKLPTTRVLLLALFPRGGSPTNNDKRKVILRVNELLPHLADGNAVRFLNLYDKFLEPDGTLTKEMMYDGLHPSLHGYHVWADAMQPLLDEMMRAPPLKR